MSQDYFIPKGTSLRFSSGKTVDPVLRSAIQDFFERHDCLRAYGILSVKRGWFSRKVSTLCVVHENEAAYRLASADLAQTLNAYFSKNSGFMDCMSFDLSNAEHRKLVESLMARLSFAKK